MVGPVLPLVSIVLATYHPNPDYFRGQLRSLEAQTYPNLELVVVDDSISDEVFEEVRASLDEQIRSFPCELFRNKANLGSTKTFEAAVRRAKGEYVSFCDQDDIWFPAKTESLLMTIKKEDALLAYSDMEIIDAEGVRTHKTVSKKNRRIMPVQGDGLFPFFLKRNAVTGCGMMVKRELALQAMPYPEEWYHHDHWLALHASAAGSIVYVPRALLSYRIHGRNQVGLRMLAGIHDKEDYAGKLEESIRRMENLMDVFPKRSGSIEEQIGNLKLRLEGFSKKRFMRLLRSRDVYGEDRSLRWFEALYSVVPGWIGRLMLCLIRKI